MKEARYKIVHTVRFHLCKVEQQIKSMMPEVRTVVSTKRMEEGGQKGLLECCDILFLICMLVT